MRLLDLFCGAGGAAMGYHQAGFDTITGVDTAPQKRYPFEFIQADALTYLAQHGHEYDLIHASPPCQAYSALKHFTTKEHPQLVEPCRAALRQSGVPYIIENVVGAPLHTVVMLCGSMFGLRTACGAELRRHRLFETSWLCLCPYACAHGGTTIGIYGDHPHSQRRIITVAGHQSQQATKYSRNQSREVFSITAARTAMGIPWMTMAELSQAIPPAYTRWLGRQWIAQQETRYAPTR